MPPPPPPRLIGNRILIVLTFLLKNYNYTKRHVERPTLYPIATCVITEWLNRILLEYHSLVALSLPQWGTWVKEQYELNIRSALHKKMTKHSKSVNIFHDIYFISTIWGAVICDVFRNSITSRGAEPDYLRRWKFNLHIEGKQIVWDSDIDSTVFCYSNQTLCNCIYSYMWVNNKHISLRVNVYIHVCEDSLVAWYFFSGLRNAWKIIG